jgi:transposase-like protein
MESTSDASQPTHNDRMQSAIADLESQGSANISKIARKWGVNRTTLRRRFKGEQRSYEQFRSESKQCLSEAEEEVLIGQINKLSERDYRLPVELHGTWLRRSWVGRLGRTGTRASFAGTREG